MLVHKRTKKEVNLSEISRVVLQEPPYATIEKDKFKKFPDSIVPQGFERALNVENKKMCMVYVMGEMVPDGMVQFTPECTWKEIHESLTIAVRRMDYGNHGGTIKNVGLSYHPLYRVNRSKVVDPKVGTPFECLPDRAVVFISMFQRAEGWTPIALGFDLCDCCGKMENEEVQIKKCSRCRKAKYCSKMCQSQDWPMHVKNCIAR